MVLSNRQRRGRRARNRHLWVGLAKWGAVLGLLAGASLYAYQTGVKVGADERDQLNLKYADARQQIVKLTEQSRDLADRAAKSGAPLQSLSAYMTADQVNDLMALVKARLDSGLKTDRLTAAISAAQNQRDCQAAQYRRIVVATPSIGPAGTTANFQAEQMQITAKGENATAEGGAPEAWYDAGKPVKVTITRASGEAIEVEGPLPLSKTITDGGRQMRLGFAAASQGLLAVSLDNCSYP